MKTATPIRRSKPAMRNSGVSRYLVGGVNSPVRAFHHVGGSPLLLAKSSSAFVSEGHRRYVDFIMGWGALILGHNSPSVVAALRKRLSRGILLGLTHEAEATLARLIAESFPSVEQVRFTVSGTEACMTAIKLARACTGRPKVLMFEGCYHGHSDAPMAGHTAGIPVGVSRETVAIPFNDVSALEGALHRWAGELACVIVEPVAANMGVIPPAADFLSTLRTLTRRHGILLIFDEVVTGFRVALGGAQQLYAIKADLTVFGKIIGGGLPIGAVGGPASLMQRLAPLGDVYHGGTFAGHPLAMAAGAATLQELKRRLPYRTLEGLSQRLAEGLWTASTEAGIPVQINRVGSMLSLFFSETPVTQAAEVQANNRERFARWAVGLRQRGILIPPSPFEALFVSTAHTEQHITALIKASKQIMQRS